MLMPHRRITTLQMVPLFALLGGCSLTSIGAEGRAHREAAALHKLLDGQQSYSFVVQTMSARSGYSCADQAVQVLADRRTLQKFDPPKKGRSLDCIKDMDWNLPPFSCSWKVSFSATTVESDLIDFMSIKSYQACI
jgi:hypothetical protein